MTTFKIATWNVNSLRVRLPHVLTWLHDVKPDVLALQEIKLIDAEFPLQVIEEAGYQAIVSGQKTYNGVAILSRHALTHVVRDIPELADPQRRVLGVRLNDISILNLYVPNGESVGSEKFQYKLKWLQHLDIYFKQQLKQQKKY